MSLVKNNFNSQFNTVLIEPRIRRRETGLCIKQNLFAKIDVFFGIRPRNQKKRFGQRLSKSKHAPGKRML